MSRIRPSGTEGYADEAEAFFKQCATTSFAEVHKQILPLIPRPPARILDIGAGTGRDAAGFAAMGHIVTAVEPTAELRLRAIELHASPLIDWLDDSLPDLHVVSGRGETFDVIMLTAVWMHLDEEQRRQAMVCVASMVRPGGIMALSLRHGPVPVGRRMFDVTPSETIALAQAEGLTCVQQLEDKDSLLKRPGVSWDRLVFSRND
jgi:2-polyprenyl-3-methyl-5-hydroxy-6-metoxy-1,4-benzoquinol methylase